MRICPNCETPTLELICPYDGYQSVDAALYMDPQQDPFVGTVFHNRYRIESRIAMGGMSTVYRATQLAVGRPVALKIMTRDLARDLKAVARFQQEARAVAGLRHPNTIRLFDYGQSEDGHLFLVMEFLDGEPLSHIIDRDAPFPAARAIRIAKQILDALSEAHSNGIVHRDLKPDNIFVTSVGLQKDYVKILDFGIAKVTKLEGRRSLTGTGLVIGSPGYMAPEQVQAQPSTAQTDIYAVGALTYEMLTGHPIFEGDSAIELAFKHVQDEPPHPTVDGEEIYGPLVDFIMECLNKGLEDRPATAAIALHQLQALEGAPIRSGLLPDGRRTLSGGARSGSLGVPQRRRRHTTESFEAGAGIARGSGQRTTSSARLGDVVSPVSEEFEAYRGSGGRLGWVIATILVAGAVGAGVWYYMQSSRQQPAPAPAQAKAGAGASAGGASVSSGKGAGIATKKQPATARDAGSKVATADAGPTASGTIKGKDAGPSPARDAGAATVARDAAGSAKDTAVSVKDAGAVAKSGKDAGTAAKGADVVTAADGAVVKTRWTLIESRPKGAKIFINTAARRGKYVKVGVTPYKVEWRSDTNPPRVMLKSYHYEYEKKRLREWHDGKTLRLHMEFDDSW